MEISGDFRLSSVSAHPVTQVSTTETTITVNLELSETGTAWCQVGHLQNGFSKVCR